MSDPAQQREGKKQPGMLKMEFEQALDEAQSFFMDVGEGKWTKETPKQVMQEVSKLRPLSYVSTWGLCEYLRDMWGVLSTWRLCKYLGCYANTVDHTD